VGTLNTKLILDNWLLSEVEELLFEGCSPEVKPRLVVDPECGTDEWDRISSALLQVDSLIRLLVDVVTRDELIVDARYAAFWGRPESPLHRLVQEDIVKIEKIDTSSPEGRRALEALLTRLCATERLRTQQAENQRTWKADGTTQHQAHSVIVWGAAGYLTRSHLTGVPYSGHPLRKLLIERTLFRHLSLDAGTRTLRWIDAQRSKVFENIAQDGSGYQFGVILPPVAIEIVESAQSPAGLLDVALQMRREYAPLRAWMARYQQALDSEDPRMIIKHDKVFRSVSENVNRKLGQSAQGSTAVSISLGCLGLDIPLSPERVLQRVGVRAVMNRMIFAKRGKGSLNKLLGMFGERSSSLGAEVVEGLLTPSPTLASLPATT
jgi:hypothetical protein